MRCLAIEKSSLGEPEPEGRRVLPPKKDTNYVLVDIDLVGLGDAENLLLGAGVHDREGLSRLGIDKLAVDQQLGMEGEGRELGEPMLAGRRIGVGSTQS